MKIYRKASALMSYLKIRGKELSLSQPQIQNVYEHTLKKHPDMTEEQIVEKIKIRDQRS